MTGVCEEMHVCVSVCVIEQTNFTMTGGVMARESKDFGIYFPYLYDACLVIT